MLVPTHRRPITPGEVLREDWLEPLGLTQGQMAEALGVDRTSVNELINDKRSLTPEMAMRLSRITGTSIEYWMNLQLGVDLFDIMHSPVRKQIDRLQMLKAS